MSDGEEAIQDTQEHMWLVYIPIEDLNQIMVHGANIRLSTMDLSIMGLEGAEKLRCIRRKGLPRKSGWYTWRYYVIMKKEIVFPYLVWYYSFTLNVVVE